MFENINVYICSINYKNVMLYWFRNLSILNVVVSNMYVWIRIIEVFGDELLYRYWYDLWVGTELYVCKKKC